ncbi:hypothetical protein AB4H89_001365 [Salmonella enterica]|nr:hypothetical protein [Salmonella enterica]ELE3133102.1 hypothetical protein [Salmonella enterica]ELF0564991.1 hypothetical protein [Salmonella enterica]ELO2078695.1 hypothetical protein [Salmonella enterica]ELO2805995.1 hypothetical protein [Salmonella enterica]
MNKINNFLGITALLFSGMSSVYAASSTSTSTLTISGTITSASCTASFPGDYTIPSITEADYESAGAGTQLGTDMSVGKIRLTGCGSKTVTLTTNGTGNLPVDTKKGTFTYSNPAKGTDNPLVYTLGYTDGDLSLDNSVPVDFSPDTINYDIPLTLKVMKNGSTLADIYKYIGNFSTTVTYSIAYK